MKMFAVILAACIAVSAQGMSTKAPGLQQTADVKVLASPTSIHNGFTKFLTVNCTFYHGPQSDFSTIMSLILSKSSSPSKDDFSEVASLTAFSGDSVDVKDTVGGSVSGHLQANSESFIALEWTYPSGTVEGKYKCEAYGMDKRGHPRVSSAVTSISEKSVDLDMVLENMKKMDSTLDALIAYKQSLTSRLDNSREAIMSAEASHMGVKYYLSHPMMMNSAVADSLCRLYGGYIVEIDNEDEYTFVSDFVQKNANGDNVALGASDEEHEGSWKFIHCGDPMTTLHWQAGQPDGQGHENCLYLASNSTDVGMFDDACAGPSMDRFICEINPHDP